MRWLLALAVFLAPPALAEDPPEPPLAVSSVRDVLAAVDAKKADGEILGAIKSSSATWRPKDVFELIDKRVPEPITRGLATKLGLFWDDGYAPLDQIAANARKFGDPTTLKLNNTNLVLLFEWFNDVKYEREAAVKSVGSLAPKGAGEPDSAYDVKKRKHDVDKAKALGKPDGKVEALTVELVLAGAWEPFDARRGCGRAKLDVPMSEVDFFVFRETMGSLGAESVVELKSRSVASMRFVADANRRIEAYSFDLCTSESSYSSLASKPVSLEATLQRTFDGKWSGRGELMSGGNRIPAQR